MTQIRAFIFDLDGVLTDTAEQHFQAWKQLADEEGLSFSREENEALRGISRRESLNLLLKGRQIAEEQAQDWMERKNRYYLDRIRRLTSKDLLPGVWELLQEIRHAGLKIAVASASKNAAEVVTRLGIFPLIDVLVDGNSGARTKPAPDLFLLAARRLGEPPEACVVVEDAAAGIEAARAAGMRTIGLGPPKRVGAARLVLPSLNDICLEDLLKPLQAPSDIAENIR